LITIYFRVITDFQITEMTRSNNFILALVDKLYTAQKVREEAMTTRMKLLLDEKEELYKRIRRLERDHGYLIFFSIFSCSFCLKH